MGPMIYLDSDRLKTIQVALASFKEEYTANYGAIMAGTVISIIPVVIVYAFAQKYIVEGIAYAGVKG
jgi:multiple sugar transport system permease protein